MVAMDQLIQELKKYLDEVTGMKITVEPLDSANLPYYLTRQYKIAHLSIGKIQLTAVLIQGDGEFTPAQFVKHVQKIPNTSLEEICVVAGSLPSYVRKRLIEKKISFIVPRTQMYLPAFGMEWRLRAKRKRGRNVEHFTPATQVVIIYWLLGQIDSITPSELSKKLNYSAMSMSRAVDQLDEAEVAQVSKQGKERVVSFQNSKRNIWEQTLPRLRSPVSRIVRIRERELGNHQVLRAGLFALSQLSMLNDTKYAEYAISREYWKTLKAQGVYEIPIDEPGTCKLQIWRYDPKILEVDGCVDPFSLNLSLKDEEDERIEMAMEGVLEKYLW
jgi:DNA-binding MarR family transcriptional regulator